MEVLTITGTFEPPPKLRLPAMKLRPNSVGVAGVLQRYQQILRGYSTTRAEEKFKSPDGHNSASASAYEVLGLPETCNATSIRMAFRKLAKATHPDLQSQASTVEFIRVLAAYEVTHYTDIQILNHRNPLPISALNQRYAYLTLRSALQ